MWFLILTSLSIVLTNCAGKILVSNSDEAIDPIIDMLLNPEQYEDLSKMEQFHANVGQGERLAMTEELWICGDCTNLDKSNLIYNERYKFDIDDFKNQNIDIQIGLSLKEMRCITLKTEETGQVFRISGTCFTDVTLSVVDSKHCDVNVYG